MRHPIALFVFLSIVSTSFAQGNRTLVWSDEFNTEGPLNEADWNYEKGFVRNYELQWYQPDNAICRDGCLIITARHEQVKNPNYVKFDNTQQEGRPRFPFRHTRSARTHSRSRRLMACHMDTRHTMALALLWRD